MFMAGGAEEEEEAAAAENGEHAAGLSLEGDGEAAAAATAAATAAAAAGARGEPIAVGGSGGETPPSVPGRWEVSWRAVSTAAIIAPAAALASCSR